MEGVYDENERQTEGVDRVSWRICERGVYSVFMDTSDEKKTHKKREKGKVGWRGQKHFDILCWGVEADARGERKDRQTNDVVSEKV